MITTQENLQPSIKTQEILQPRTFYHPGNFTLKPNKIYQDFWAILQPRIFGQFYKPGFLGNFTTQDFGQFYNPRFLGNPENSTNKIGPLRPNIGQKICEKRAKFGFNPENPEYIFDIKIF